MRKGIGAGGRDGVRFLEVNGACPLKSFKNIAYRYPNCLNVLLIMQKDLGQGLGKSKQLMAYALLYMFKN